MEDEFRAELVKLLPRLERFAYALTGSLDRGDDLVQEACVKALARVDQWQPGTRLDNWMFQILKNAWIDGLRSAKTRGEVVDIDSVHDLSGVDGRDVVEVREELDLVTRAMASLTEDQKVLIALICIDGLPYKEVAEIVDAPIGTVMSRLARARVALHDAVESGRTPNPRRHHG